MRKALVILLSGLVIFLTYCLGYLTAVSDQKETSAEFKQSIIRCVDSAKVFSMLVGDEIPANVELSVVDAVKVMSLQIRVCLDKEAGKKFFKENFKIEGDVEL